MPRARCALCWCAALAGVISCLAQSPTPPVIRPAPHSFLRHVRATGTVQPVEAVGVQVPEIVDSGGNMVLTKIIPSGTVVQPGDLVAEFDRTRQLDQARDAKAKYEDLQHQVEQRRAQHRSDDEKRASELQQAEADLAKAQIELRKGPLLSEIDRLKAEAKLEIARLHVASLKKTIESHKTADAADLKIVELQRDRQKLAMERAQANAERLQVHAPIAGMASQEIVWRNDGPGNPQAGDQLWPGQALLRIFSETEMEIQVTLAEPDQAALRPGTRAQVRLDAYPAIPFSATFVSAAPVATSLIATNVRTFVGRFRLEQRDPHLLPDLSAAVDLEVRSDQPVLAAPRTAVRFHHGKPYVLRVEDGGARHETEVALGVFDATHIEIKSGLGPSDRILAR